jgi:aldose 1-epimerase
MLQAFDVGFAHAPPPPPPSFFNCSEQGADAFAPVQLTNAKGTLRATMIAYGATMTHLFVHDHTSVPRDVILGWDDATQYCANAEHTYFGATIGRVANRVAKCELPFKGKVYPLSCNEKGWDTIHGGVVGFDRVTWKVVAQRSSSVTWQHTSPDGAMGFPGEVTINVTHTIGDDDSWTIEYSAAADADTVLMLTNHAYFNLNANVDNTPTVLEHVLSLPTATAVLEVTGAPNYHLIPTGKVLDVARGSFVDFWSKPKAVGKDIDGGVVTALGGYDNAFVFASADASEAAAASPSTLPVVATVSSPLTNITMTMRTDQPSVQVYTGNFLNGTDPALRLRRKASQSYGAKPQYYQWRGAITFEAQGYPDAPHNANFPSIELAKGKRYVQRTSYTFGIVE